MLEHPDQGAATGEEEDSQTEEEDEEEEEDEDGYVVYKAQKVHKINFSPTFEHLWYGISLNDGTGVGQSLVKSVVFLFVHVKYA